MKLTPIEPTCRYGHGPLQRERQLKASFGGKKAPPELGEWRLEWMSAFDAAMPQDGEIERAYLERVTGAKNGASRSLNKLEMALE